MVHESTPYVILTPLRIEYEAVSRALGSAGLSGYAPVIQTGPGADRIRAAVDAAVEDPETLLILAGVAGGLIEGLGVTVGVRVIDEADGVWEVPETSALIGDGLRRIPVLIAGVDRAVTSVRGKRDLHNRTGADIVDTESHAFAEACRRQGCPWMILRSISDGPSHSLPASISEWVTVEGATNGRRVAGDLLRRPYLVPRVFLLGRRTRRALSELSSVLVDFVRADLSHKAEVTGEIGGTQNVGAADLLHDG